MKSLNDLIGDIDKKQRAIAQLEKSFPPAIGVICVKEIKNNFKIMQGVWKKRSPVTDTLYEYNRTSAYRTPKLGKKSKHVNPYKGSVVHASNPVLLQTRNLRESITYQAIGNGVLIGVFHRMSPTGHDSLSYAQLLNEGGKMKVFNHQGTMPARPFMPRPNQGPTPEMWRNINQKYKIELGKVMGNWK